MSSVYPPGGVDSQSLKELAASISSKMKLPGIVVTGTDKSWSDIPGWLSTGSTILDAVMTSYDAEDKPLGSGLALGRWTEIFGLESTGKTTLYTHFMVECQKQGGLPVLIDSEARFYKPRAQKMGLNLSGLLEIKAEWFEKGLEAIVNTLEMVQSQSDMQGRPILICWDTIATVPTKKEFEEGAYAGGMAEKPRLLRAMARDLATQLSQYNAHLVLVNQVGATMNSYGKQTDTSGGGGPKYQSSVRLEISKAGQFNDVNKADEVAGIITRVKVVKSSLFRPLAQVELPLYFNSGVHDILSVLQHLIKTGDIQSKGGRYYYPAYFGDAAPGKYMRDLLAAAVDDEVMMCTMKKRCLETINVCWQKATKEEKEK